MQQQTKNKVLTIDLGRFKKPTASAFTGRPQGKLARQDLKLDEKDAEGAFVRFVIPADTTSFNPSFFLGLLYDSYKYYGPKGFDEHYSFDLSMLPTAFRAIIQNNLDDGKRNAANAYDKKSVFSLA